MMKILTVCFQASPNRGSEFSVGWGWLTMIAKQHELWVITNDSEKESVIAERDSNPVLQEIRFIFVSWNTRWVGTAIWPMIRRIRYRRWRRKALAVAKIICNENAIDVCHYVNAVGFLDVVPLWKTGAPFVWGPVGGLSFVDGNLLKHLDLRSRLFYAVKNCFRFLAIKLASPPRHAAEQASAIIAATEQTRTAIRSHWNKDSVVIAEIGTPDMPGIAEVRERNPNEVIRIVWSGRLHSGKAPRLLLDALARLDSAVNWQLDLLGDGVDREMLTGLAEAHHIDSRCKFHGWLSRSDAIQIMTEAHLFVLTSIYDLTSNVLVEAMNCALPVICLSSQSAASIVGKDCGIVVRVDNADEIVTGLSAGILRLYENESTRLEMARKSLSRARMFDWDSKSQALEQIYAAIQD